MAAKVNKNNILTRYFFVVLLFVLLGIAIILKASAIMFLERDYWKEVGDRFVVENVQTPANRGNILSSDGKLMASSLPEYRIYMDFQAGGKRKDSILMASMESITGELHRIIPSVSAKQFRARLMEGRRIKSRYYLICPERISYIQLKEIKSLPFFSLGRNTSGLVEEPFNQRKKPFGSLARRTLGDVYADTTMGAKNGLELAFDSILRGKPGITHRQKVLNKYLNIKDLDPSDGYDIVSTIDVDMQDICEKALVDKLKELNALVGVAVLMEVKTGEVRAIVNMTRGKDGAYYESQSNAISDMMEPGSTFKTASIMVALEDGYITPETMVDTGNGQRRMHGKIMRDWNWAKGGYGTISVTRVLEVSSNVGVSSLIEKYYATQPDKFVQGLKRMSLDEPLHLQITGEGKPNIRGPKERYWSKTTLPWMSIGYETQVPPMNILTFYNAIANDGVMVRPKFASRAVKDGKTVKEFPTEVINPSICSKKTLREIQDILAKVVSEGLAKPAGSKQFAVAGKTGTAQISQGQAGYTSGGRKYLVSFCGYFPAEAPRYSLIVSIQKPDLPASGGTMAGSVFSRIAEKVYAKNLRYDLESARDTVQSMLPGVKDGSLTDAYYVLDHLDINAVREYSRADGMAWGEIRQNGEHLSLVEQQEKDGLVPSVIGMGAADALYLLEKSGMSVHLQGKGKVRSQSVKPGTSAVKGQYIALHLEQ